MIAIIGFDREGRNDWVDVRNGDRLINIAAGVGGTYYKIIADPNGGVDQVALELDRPLVKDLSGIDPGTTWAGTKAIDHFNVATEDGVGDLEVNGVLEFMYGEESHFCSIAGADNLPIGFYGRVRIRAGGIFFGCIGDGGGYYPGRLGRAAKSTKG